MENQSITNDTLFMGFLYDLHSLFYTTASRSKGELTSDDPVVGQNVVHLGIQSKKSRLSLIFEGGRNGQATIMAMQDCQEVQKTRIDMTKPDAFLTLQRQVDTSLEQLHPSRSFIFGV